MSDETPMLTMLRASSRVVVVQPWMVAELGIAAVWFAQLLWYMETTGETVVKRGDHEWEAETGLNRGQVLRAKNKVVERGWITCEVRKVKGTPTSHVELVEAAIEADLRTIHCPISDKPGSRDSAQSSSSQMVLDGESHPDRAVGAAQSIEDQFAEFYAAYPRRVGRGHALKAYRAALKKVNAATLLEAAHRYTDATKGKEARYIAHPTSWLNGERWADEADAPASGKGHQREIDNDRGGETGELEL